METLDLTKYLDDPNCALFISDPGFAISFYLRLSDYETEKNMTELIWLHGGRVEKDQKDMNCRTVLLVDSETYRPQVFDRIAFSSNYVTDCVVENTLLPLARYAFRTPVTEPFENFIDVIFYRKREFKIFNFDDWLQNGDQTYTIISRTKASKQIRKDQSEINLPKQLASSGKHQNSTKDNSEPKFYLQKNMKIILSEDGYTQPKQVDETILDNNHNEQIKEKPSNFLVEKRENSSTESCLEDDSDSNPRKATKGSAPIKSTINLPEQLASKGKHQNSKGNSEPKLHLQKNMKIILSEDDEGTQPKQVDETILDKNHNEQIKEKPSNFLVEKRINSSAQPCPEDDSNSRKATKELAPIKSTKKIRFGGKEIKIFRSSPRNEPSTSKSVMNAYEGKTKFPNKKANKIVQLRDETNSDSDDSSANFGPKPVARQPRYNTREPYTQKEKEIILKYILRRGKLSGLRSDVIWKEMERERVLPRRSWQSLKNHFCRTLVNELDKFPFLNETDKKLIKNE